MKKKKKIESEFQKDFTDKLKSEIPECIIMKNNANYINGIPDWIMICPKGYAMFECKDDEDAHKRPLQDYYIDKFKDWGKQNKQIYSAFVFPQNVDNVLKEVIEKFK